MLSKEGDETKWIFKYLPATKLKTNELKQDLKQGVSSCHCQLEVTVLIQAADDEALILE